MQKQKTKKKNVAVDHEFSRIRSETYQEYNRNIAETLLHNRSI